MNIEQFIIKLLYQNQPVKIKGLGIFYPVNKNAGIHPGNHQFDPPKRTINFESNPQAEDNSLADLIAKDSATSVEKAKTKIQEWVDKIFSDLKAGKKVQLKDIGFLYYDYQGHIQLEVDQSFNFSKEYFGLPSFKAELATPSASEKEKTAKATKATEQEKKEEKKQQKKEKHPPKEKKQPKAKKQAKASSGKKKQEVKTAKASKVTEQEEKEEKKQPEREKHPPKEKKSPKAEKQTKAEPKASSGEKKQEAKTAEATKATEQEKKEEKKQPEREKHPLKEKTSTEAEKQAKAESKASSGKKKQEAKSGESAKQSEKTKAKKKKSPAIIVIILLIAIIGVAGWYFQDTWQGWLNTDKIPLIAKQNKDSATDTTEAGGKATADTTKIDTTQTDTMQTSTDTITKPEKTKSAEKPSRETEKKKSNQGDYMLIAGCFRSEQNARDYVDELRNEGYDASIQGQTSQGLQKVVYGVYQQKSEALNTLQRIKQEENRGAWLDKR